MLNNNKYIFMFSALSIMLTSQAHSVEKNTDKALVKDNEYMILTNYPNTLNIIDVEKDEIFKQCELPGEYGPGQVMMSPDKNRAYILSNGFREIYGVNVDTCKMEFKARFAQESGEDARSMFSMAISADGKEVYTVTNPTKKYADHYRVQKPRLQVYSADDGLSAKPIRTFPAPRQIYIMQAAEDGTLYAAGPDIYEVDVNTGQFDVAIPLRNWERENYGQPDVLYFWPHQQYNKDFSILYTAPKTTDDGEEDFVYGYLNINLETGEKEVKDFGPVTEVYFTGMSHPAQPGYMYGVLNNLNKYDVEKEEQVKSEALKHTYYNINFNKKGDKIYLAGTLSSVSVHDAESLEKLTEIDIGGGDQAITTAQMFIR